jgi:2,4-dienoyl-CoA reductase-like NADH-dependent reductase (Old Yellow Enzyme family)
LHQRIRVKSYTKDNPIDMNKPFESTEINGMELANRFVRSATWEGMATQEGACTPALVDLMSGLARGGVGLIITSYAYVRRDGQAAVRQLGIYEDTLIEGFRHVTKAVHDLGGRIALQIVHGGLYADPKLTKQVLLAPSRLEGVRKSEHREMILEDIREVVEAFGHAAYRAREAGFDGVQIHAAHGYLLSQFLSPAFNKREDDYGGPVENRARALLEVLSRIKTEVGNDFPVLVKVNSKDFMDGGLSLEDAVKVGAMLQEAGIDAIELSGGTPLSGKLGTIRKEIKSEEDEAYFRNSAKVFKTALRIPLILVGGIRSIQVAEKLLREGIADYISMSRPFVREPALVKRWASGDLSRATCLSDSLCFRPVVAGEGIYCVTERKQQAALNPT